MAREAPCSSSSSKTKRSPLQWLRNLLRSKSKKVMLAFDLGSPSLIIILANPGLPLFQHRSETLLVSTPRTPPLPAVQPVSPNSGLTDDEKDMIFRATRRDGVWYMCPKRHPYLVTECGTPVQMATCPSCGSVIGGKHHKFIGAYNTGRLFFARKGVV